MKEYTPHSLGEVCAVYFSKGNLSEYQVFPVPEDLENWYKFEVTDMRDLKGMQYDPSTDSLVPYTPPNEFQTALRQEAYITEADPLYLAAQYDIRMGIKSEEEALKPWVDKVSEIKARYPLQP